LNSLVGSQVITRGGALVTSGLTTTRYQIPVICSSVVIVITPVFIAMAEFQIHVG